MRPAVRLAAILAVLALTGGCAHAPPKPPPPAPPPGLEVRPYFPLAVGNSWTYKGHLLGETVTHTVTIVAHRDGWFIDSEGQHYRLDGRGLRSRLRYLLQAPLAQGHTWTAVVSISSTEHYEIADTGVPAYVPAGHFTGCLRVLARNRHDARRTLFMESTYCRDVGLVHLRTWMQVAGQGAIPESELMLVRYHLVKPGPRP